jgi:hypothetical protein
MQYVVSLTFSSLCCLLITRLTFLIHFFVFWCSISCILPVCTVLYTVTRLVHSCLFSIFAQVYRPLLPGGNPVAVNTYHINTRHLSHTYSRLRSCASWKWEARKTEALAGSSDKSHADVIGKTACINRQFPRTDKQNRVHVIACVVLTGLLHVSILFFTPRHRTRCNVEKFTK